MKMILVLLLCSISWSSMIMDSLFFPNAGKLQCGNTQHLIISDTLGIFTIFNNNDSIIATSKLGATNIYDFFRIGDTFYFACRQTFSLKNSSLDSSKLYIKKCLLRNDSLLPIDSLFIQKNTQNMYVDAKLLLTDNSLIFICTYDWSGMATYINRIDNKVRNVHPINTGRIIRISNNKLYVPFGNHIDIYNLLTPNSLIINEQWVFTDSILDFCFNSSLDTMPLISKNGLTLYALTTGTPQKVSLIYPFVPSYPLYINYVNGSVYSASYNSMRIFNIPSQQSIYSSLYADYRIYGNSIYCQLMDRNGIALRWRDSLFNTPVETTAKHSLQTLIQLSPNPFNGEINISAPNLSSNMNVSIYNSIGQRVFDVKAASSSIFWNASNLPNGIYIAKIKIGVQQISKKIFLVK